MRKTNDLGLNKSFKFKNYLNYTVILAVLAVLMILQFTGAAGTDFNYKIMPIVIPIGVYVILALSLNMVVGFLGELSLGHAGFMCIGAFVGGKIASLLDTGDNANISVMLIALILGGLCAALFGFIVGLPALRLRGDYLAIVTLAFNMIITDVIKEIPFFAKGSNLPTPSLKDEYNYIIIFAIILITLAVIQNFARSKHGRAIMSIRDNEIAARTMGINIVKYKLTVFTISAFFAGIAGVLWSYYQPGINYEMFKYNVSIEILVMVVLGGMGSVNGSILAAALITFINNYGKFSEESFAPYRTVLYALILIIVVIYRNAPGLKGFREKYNMKDLFAKIFKKKTSQEKLEDIADKETKKSEKSDKKEQKLSNKVSKKAAKSAKNAKKEDR
ncbi:MAG: branched-chain amino acid ABC transporter permease [Clostridia bacterium]|nr:branched-chain amino acid ABC transporter permease [Clostridia bacterium]